MGNLLDVAIKLLSAAKCPNCDGVGYFIREIGGCSKDGENDTRECIQEECQWCFEVKKLLDEYKVLINAKA